MNKIITDYSFWTKSSDEYEIGSEFLLVPCNSLVYWNLNRDPKYDWVLVVDEEDKKDPFILVNEFRCYVPFSCIDLEDVFLHKLSHEYGSLVELIYKELKEGKGKNLMRSK